MRAALHKLTRTKDSYQVTIPVDIARRWVQEDCVAVRIEWVGPGILITPITLRGLESLTTGVQEKEAEGAGHHS